MEENTLTGIPTMDFPVMEFDLDLDVESESKEVKEAPEDQAHEQEVDMALSMYIGYKCSECGHKFSSLKDLNEKHPICTGKDDKGIKMACKKCFDKIESSQELIAGLETYN